MSRMKNWEELALKGSHFAQKRGFVGTNKAFLEPTRPPKEKKNRKTYFAIVCITVLAGSRGILDSKPAAQELPCLGVPRRMLPVPEEYSIVNLQRGNVHPLWPL